MTVDWHAWIDESGDAGSRGGGFYVLAAAVGSPEQCTAIRTTLHHLLLPKQARLHWSKESDARHNRWADVIVGLDLAYLAVVAPLHDATKQERARRKCLERLLYELDQLGVTRAWIESRQRHLDKRDREMVEAMLGSGGLSDAFRASFARALDEPMLWLPDAVAGMTTADERGGQPTWARRFGTNYQHIRL